MSQLQAMTKRKVRRRNRFRNIRPPVWCASWRNSGRSLIVRAASKSQISRHLRRLRERSRLGDRLAVANCRNETMLVIRATTVGGANYYAILAVSIDRARLFEILF